MTKIESRKMRQGEGLAARRQKTADSHRQSARDFAFCGLFSALIAVGAFIRIVIPAGADTINFTLQWFFVLLAGLLLGSRRAAFSVSVYLLIGLVGVPIFARGGGPSYLIRPTFGFLLGFALAAWLIGKICELAGKGGSKVWLAAATAGYGVYYGMGLLYFYLITHFVAVIPSPLGLGAIFLIYCLPTMIPDYVLCIAAVTAAGRLRPVVRQMMES